MGHRLVLVGDIGTGHDGFPPTAVIAGSPTVMIDGKPVARQGDPLAPHDKPKHPQHPRTIAEGSGTILIDGKPAALTGHAVSCGGVVMGSASTVGNESGSSAFTSSFAMSAGSTAQTQASLRQETTRRQAAEEPAMSQAGKQWLKDVEQLRLMPYNDQTGREITSWIDGATIGYGHLISETKWPLYQGGVNHEQAELIFEEDLVPYAQAVSRAISTPLAQHQFDAAVILAYNIGTNAFSSSSAVKLINDPDAETPYSTLEAAWKAFNRSQGVVNRGLVNRRAAEWDMYSKGEYRRW